ncbi:MAG: phosphoglycerate kinase [Desulfurella sp.]|uniref:phosphoglycerate kinase n=1 Tax=Desulfurella sp. TaxID=1962857 RepID=UPI003D0E7DAA
MIFINELNLTNKRVFVRCDFNVPIDDEGNIMDDKRIRETLPTINYCMDAKAKVILASHMGRPKGKKDPKYSLANVAKRLSRLLNKEVKFIDSCVGDEVKKAIDSMDYGDCLLLENLRFQPGEEKDDIEFAKKLKELFDVYINDAFGVSHRKHTSVYTLPKICEIKAAGFLLKKEITYFSRILDNPVRPLIAVLGGAKVSSKISAVYNLIDKVDKIIIGGAMVFTFFKALGLPVGNSLVENDYLETAKDIYQKAQDKKIKMYFPVDFVVSEKMDEKAVTKIVPYQEIPDGYMGLDIGPASCKMFEEVMHDCGSIVWNGPMGVYEIDRFSRGTREMARIVGSSYALSVAGGGDTADAIARAHETDNITYISTGGGASLELLEGKKLPGIEALEA